VNGHDMHVGVRYRYKLYARDVCMGWVTVQSFYFEPTGRGFLRCYVTGISDCGTRVIAGARNFTKGTRG
jgi:hypothetical protein